MFAGIPALSGSLSLPAGVCPAPKGVFSALPLRDIACSSVQAQAAPQWATQTAQQPPGRPWVRTFSGPGFDQAALGLGTVFHTLKQREKRTWGNSGPRAVLPCPPSSPNSAAAHGSGAAFTTAVRRAAMAVLLMANTWCPQRNCTFIKATKRSSDPLKSLLNM